MKKSRNISFHRTADDESARQVTTKEGLSIGYRYKCPFIEVSAKTGVNVNEAFELLANEVRKFKQVMIFYLALTVPRTRLSFHHKRHKEKRKKRFAEHQTFVIFF